MSEQVICQYCGKPIPKGNMNNYRWKRRKFCSRRCDGLYKNHVTKVLRPHPIDPSKHTKLTCQNCSVEFEVPNYLVRKGARFCSKSCAAASRRKNKFRDFNGKRYRLNPNGYYYADDNSRLCRDVWEYHNGQIPAGYIIHHIDGNKGNDDINNLQMMKEAEHLRMHNLTPEYRYVTCQYCGKTIKRKKRNVWAGHTKYCSSACANKHKPILRKLRKEA